jgi:hypothetical protein
MKKSTLSREKAARILTALAEKHLDHLPEDEREARVNVFRAKVSKLRSKPAKSSKPLAASPRRRQFRIQG